jgi:transcriptional regulator
MYIAKHFATSDLRELDALVERRPFAIVVTDSEAGLDATPVPILYWRDGAQVTLEWHLSVSNLQSQRSSNALIIISGPDAYISPSWYLDKDQNARVPTWNYIAAHLVGLMEVRRDESTVAMHLRGLTALNERRVNQSWQIPRDDPRYAAQMSRVVVCRLVTRDIRIKVKASQNQPAENRVRVAERLRSLKDPASTEMAQFMVARL